jgi:hypothetical protein
MTHVANMFTHRVVYLTTDAVPSNWPERDKGASVEHDSRQDQREYRELALGWR